MTNQTPTIAPSEAAAPADSASPRSSVLQYAPGLAAVALGTALSYLVNLVVPVVSALTVAVVLGALARNAGLLGPRSLPGAALATKRLLRAGVVLLGLQLAVPQILHLGLADLAVVVSTVLVTFFGTQWMGRRIGVSRGCSLMVATGFSICGASAVAAMDGVTHTADSEEQDVATAVALITIFGSLAIVGLPLLQAPLGLSDTQFGAWAGASVHEVAQVVATASTAGAAALAVAVVVKLTRVVLLAPIVAGVSLARRREVSATEIHRPPLVPLFVLGFLAMVLVRSVGLLPGGVLDAAQLVTTLLLAGALFGLGTAVHLPSLVRTGGRAVALGAASTALAATVAYLGIQLVS